VVAHRTAGQRWREALSDLLINGMGEVGEEEIGEAMVALDTETREAARAAGRQHGS